MRHVPYTDEEWIERVRANSTITDSGCWLWNGWCGKSRGLKEGQRGYAEGSKHGRKVRIARAILAIRQRPLQPGELACHTCDTPSCVNPDHLWIGTQSDNIWDARRKNRHAKGRKTHCMRGHPLSGDNLFVARRPNGDTHRHCIACQRRRQRIRAGWPEHLADTLDVTPHGHRPVNGRFHRRKQGDSHP